MIVVDTSVLVYAVGREHPLRRPCREVIELIRHGRVRATTAVEVIQEFAHVRARRRSRVDAATIARDYAELLGPLLVVHPEDLVPGLAMFEQHERLGAFDSVLAAVAVRSGSRGLVSADGAFGDVDGVTHLDPAAPGFIESLVNTG